MKNTNKAITISLLSLLLFTSAVPVFAQDDNGSVGGITDEVKKPQSCDKKYDVSGYAYVDSNNNNKRDNNEDGVKGIEVRIYDESDSKVYFDNDKTNGDGFWKLSVCDGEYEVKPQTDTLPDDTKIENDDKLTKVEVDGKNVENVNIRVNEESGFNYLWIIIPVLAILAVAIVVALAKSANQDEA